VLRSSATPPPPEAVARLERAIAAAPELKPMAAKYKQWSDEVVALLKKALETIPPGDEDLRLLRVAFTDKSVLAKAADGWEFEPGKSNRVALVHPLFMPRLLGGRVHAVSMGGSWAGKMGKPVFLRYMREHHAAASAVVVGIRADGTADTRDFYGKKALTAEDLAISNLRKALAGAAKDAGTAKARSKLLAAAAAAPGEWEVTKRENLTLYKHGIYTAGAFLQVKNNKTTIISYLSR
jgi:hypothetical protein